MVVEVDASVVERVFCVGFVSAKVPVDEVDVVDKQAAADEHVAALVDPMAAVEAVVREVEALLEESKMQWWHLAHLRIFQPAYAQLPDGVLRAALERSLQARSARASPAITLVPVSDLEGGVAIVAQITAHDPLKLDTERWVRTLDR